MDTDERVAREIMGWHSFAFHWCKPSDEADGEFVILIRGWQPSKRIEQALGDSKSLDTVVGKMKEADYWFSMSYRTERCINRELLPEWWARFRCIRGGTRPDGYAGADTAPMAICQAALKAKGGEHERPGG